MLFGAKGSAFDAKPDRVLKERDAPEYGESIAAAGDVNGDSFSDIIVTARDAQFIGVAHIYFGGSHSTSTWVRILWNNENGRNFSGLASEARDKGPSPGRYEVKETIRSPGGPR